MATYDFLDFDGCVAFEINEFAVDDWVASHRESFSVLYINIRSIKNKFSELCSLIKLLSVQFTFIVLTETMLTNDLDFNFEINGYKSVAIYRTRSGGGIKVYWRDILNARVLDNLSGLYLTHEALFLQAEIAGMGTVTIGAIYRPPNLSMDNFKEYIETNIMSRQFKKLILVGDFNIDMLKVDNDRKINEFVGMMHSYGHCNYINLPTYFSPIHGQMTTILDHYWHNLLKSCKSYIVSPPLADHLSCCLMFDDAINDNMQTSKFRDFSMNNRNQFEVNLMNECAFYNPPVTDANVSTYYTVNWLRSVSDKYFPVKIKTLSKKRAEAPWLSTRLLRCIRKKHWLFKLLKQKIVTYDIYKTYASLLRFALSISERNYHKNKFISCKNNSRRIWKHLNTMLGRISSNSVCEFKINGTVIRDTKLISEYFADHFNKIPKITQRSAGLSNINLLTIVPLNNNSLFLAPSTNIEVSAIISGLKNSNDLTDVPSLLIKIAVGPISLFVSNLYNLCLSEGTYPDMFKIARIVPIFKKGDKSLMNNYRPISILPVLNKIFEKLTLSRLNSFIDENNIISSCQHGFRSSYSTDTAMLDLMRHVLPAFSNKSFAICVFIDFSKAFDTVDHRLLLNKLERYGLRGLCLEFFTSYLDNRFMFVNYNNNDSEKYPVDLSVPQGSCMGPVLYNLYTNDLNNYLDDIAKVVYADDTNLIIVSDDYDSMIEFLNDKLEMLSEWCKFNKLCLNAEKTKFMIMSPLSLPYEPIVKINSNQLERVTCIKYLGIMFDDNIKFHEQTNALNNKLSRICGITFRLAQFYSFDVAKTFYYSFVFSAISYGIVVWGGYVVETGRINRTQAYQDRIIKNLFCRYFPGQPINEVFKQLKIITITDLYRLKCAEFMYKIMILNNYPDLKQFLLSACVQSVHQTRYCHRLRPTFPRVDVIKLSFWYRFISIWNNVPQDIKMSVNIRSFKNKLTDHMLSLY
jgi:hypothetical protein